MRIERLNYNKIKIFLTSDDLMERGLTKEDIWKDSLKWHQLFHDMLEEASDEFGVKIEGSVAVEIFSMHAQGMIMIVTMEEEEEEQSLQDGFIDMAVTANNNENILFEFESFEDIIQLTKHLRNLNVLGGKLYNWNQKYFLSLKEDSLHQPDSVIAILSEFGDVSLRGIPWLEEYGQNVINDHAIETIIEYFLAK
ncbi:genetic competence negative regulator [Robertmurraya massiliosenegalensis]|uniref:genetic competence negative regulator n=1 Tax=Robertmurraya massiliosenegalensis TaxID=1287657 RepID=UPI00030412BC|nr:genetic competence negative regulator [Robertmurraya massiliosenegalensis]